MHVRSPFAVALAALLTVPALAHAQTKSATQPKPAAAAPAKPPPAPAAAPASTAKEFSLGGWIGYEMGDLDGLQLRVDGIMPFQKLSPQVELSLVGSISYSYLSDSASGIDVTGNVLKFVPAARFSMPVSPEFTLFGDAGLGLYWASVSTDINFGLGTASASDSGVGFMFRFGVGGLYRVNPRMQVGASLMLDPMVSGLYDDTTFSLLAGLTYQL